MAALLPRAFPGAFGGVALAWACSHVPLPCPDPWAPLEPVLNPPVTRREWDCLWNWVSPFHHRQVSLRDQRLLGTWEDLGPSVWPPSPCTGVRAGLRVTIGHCPAFLVPRDLSCEVLSEWHMLA